MFGKYTFMFHSCRLFQAKITSLTGTVVLKYMVMNYLNDNLKT
uniref:Uncharacterized protein n=1 Tax=Anguilla anguilla TaxID=7936 RepID=A0A0E9RL53_ANGAN